MTHYNLVCFMTAGYYVLFQLGGIQSAFGMKNLDARETH